MRIHFLKALSFVIIVSAICSCDRNGGYDKDNFSSDNVCLQVDGSYVFQYEAGNGQLAYNKGRKEFRAGTDNMSDYFVLKLNALPKEEGEVVTGDLSWTTFDDTKSLHGIDFKVMKIKNPDTWWLWNSKQKIALTVKELR